MNTTADHPEIKKHLAFEPEAIFNAIVTPDAFKKWWGPVGYQLFIRTASYKPDGILLYKLSNEQDQTGLWYKMVFQEIKPPAFISFRFSFSDATGNILRAPFAPEWPLEILTSWHLASTEHGADVTISCQPYGATPAETKAFAADASALKNRIITSLDRLSHYLATI